jgi:MYXO-CTERM domain-containing protein
MEAGHATPLGFNTDPAGGGWNRGDPGTAFAVWDSFPSFTSSNDAPDSSGDLTSLGLSQSNTLTGNPGMDQGAGVYDNLSVTTVPGTDVYYGGNRAGSFTVAATSPFPVRQFYIQLERVSSEAGFIGAINPTLNGIPFDSVTNTSGGGDTTHDNGLWSTTTWYWGAALDSQNITNVNLTFSLPTHRGIDGVVIDASAVPEPAAMGLLAVAGAFALRRRR